MKRALQDLLKLLEESTWVQCNFKELVELVEHLFDNNVSFYVLDVDSDGDICTLFLKK